MTFDIGGFLGGFLGTIGAFWAAKWTFDRSQEAKEPEILRRKLELAASISTSLSKSISALYNKPKPDGIGQSIAEIQEIVVGTIDSHIPTAAELDRGIFKFLVDTRDEVNRVCFKYANGRRNGSLFDPQSVGDAIELRGAIIVYVMDRTKAVNDMRDGYIEPLRKAINV